MAQDLWGEKVPRIHRRRRKSVASLTSKIPYSITGTDNDCQIIGHTEGFRDLLGCTVCLDCGAHIFCPWCTPKHPLDENAIPVLCELHEESERTASA